MKNKAFVTMDLKAKDEVFTHKDDDGTFRTFPTGYMARMAAEWGGKCDQIKCCTIALLPEVAAHIRKNMGIEKERIDRLAEPYISIPIIGIMWGGINEPITIVDGNHRYIKLIESGAASARCYVFSRDLWEQMILNLNHGEEFLNRPSGVIEHERRAQK